jgi:hypothetical protein
MKHFILTTLFLGAIPIGFSQTNAPTAPTQTTVTSGFCNIHDMSDSCKKMMKPFMYSAQNALHVDLKSEPQVRDVTFPTFFGAKYRVIINTLSMPKGTEVDVYDEDPARNKKSKQLYSTKSLGVSNFDLQSKSGRIFIEYTIPAATATSYTGCSVVVFGFENNRN